MGDFLTDLEKYRETDKIKQRENYFTAIIRYILLNYKEIRKEFFYHILNKKVKLINRYKSIIISPRESEILIQSKISSGIPDLRIGNECIGFIAIESKINAREGSDQIWRYLNDPIINHVAYISLSRENIEEKYETNNKFVGAYRWYDIYRLIKKHCPKDKFLREVVKYMEDNEMSIETSIKYNDLLAWGKYNKLIKKMDYILDNITSLIKKDLNIVMIKPMSGDEYYGRKFLVKKSRYHNYQNIYFLMAFNAYSQELGFSVELRVPKVYWKRWSKHIEKISEEANQVGRISRWSNWFTISKGMSKIIDLKNDDKKQLKQIVVFVKDAIKSIKNNAHLREYFTKGW